jgi:two-component system OmpR family sensor kinase
MSLRHRLLLVLLLAAMATTLTATGATWYWAKLEIDELLDDQLRQQALSLEDKAYLLGQVAVTAPDPEQHIVTQLWDRRGVLRYQSHHDVELPRPRQNGYDTISTALGDWRVYTMELGPWVVQLAQPLSIRLDIAANAALRMLYPTMAILPLLALLIWWAVGRVLAPLSALAGMIAGREPAALAPLPLAGLPQEVQCAIRPGRSSMPLVARPEAVAAFGLGMANYLQAAAAGQLRVSARDFEDWVYGQALAILDGQDVPCGNVPLQSLLSPLW